MKPFVAGCALAFFLVTGCHKATLAAPAKAPNPVQTSSPAPDADQVKELARLSALLPGKWRQQTEKGIGFKMITDSKISLEFKSDGTGIAYGQPMTWKCVDGESGDPTLVITEGSKVKNFTILGYEGLINLSIGDVQSSFVKDDSHP